MAEATTRRQAAPRERTRRAIAREHPPLQPTDPRRARAWIEAAHSIADRPRAEAATAAARRRAEAAMAAVRR